MRLLRILLRVVSFLEKRSSGSQSFRVTILEAFMTSWSTDEGVSLDCIIFFEVLIIRLECIFLVSDACIG